MSVRKQKAAVQNEIEKVESKFSKEQLLSSKRFQDRKDIVNTLLSSDKLYTVEAVEKMIEDYRNRKVR